MELICDFREKRIIKILNTMVKSRNDCGDIVIKSQNLDIGDFVVGNTIIERKTHQDLASSILDGRYKEQCNRLQSFKQDKTNVKIIYFIEGNLDLYFENHNISKDKLISAMLSILYEKDFSVILTKHMNETCDFLLKLALKFKNKYNSKSSNVNDIVDLNNIDGCNSNNDNSIIETNEQVCAPDDLICIEHLVKQKNKKNGQINASNIGIMMLCNVPNISFNIAKALLEPFNNNIYAFITKINEDPDYLSEIKIMGKNNKSRKLNKNIVEILRDYFVLS
jgi:hypothetical protein